RQHFPELPAALVLRGLLPLPEIGMVAILLAAPVVIADRLDVAVWVRAEPGVAIGRRQPDPVQPVNLLAVGDPLSLRVEILPIAAAPAPADAGLAVVDIVELGRLTHGSSKS